MGLNIRLLQNLLKLTSLRFKALAWKPMYKRCNDALSVVVFFQAIVIKVFSQVKILSVQFKCYTERNVVYLLKILLETEMVHSSTC